MNNHPVTIKLESGCMKCTEENVTDEVIRERFVQALAVINESEILVNIFCKVHGIEPVFLLAHVNND